MPAELLVDDSVRPQIDKAARELIRRRVSRMVRAAALADGRDDLDASFRLTDDTTIRELNRDYRDKNKATDVLAFAAREAPGGHLQPQLLGDVVISVDTAERQATGALLDELLFLASHGLCHLLGYDHRDDQEERLMNERMASLRAEAERRGPTRAA